MLDGWLKRQQQFLSEIPFVGAILSTVSARIHHSNDDSSKAEPSFKRMSIVGCSRNFRVGYG